MSRRAPSRRPNVCDRVLAVAAVVAVGCLGAPGSGARALASGEQSSGPIAATGADEFARRLQQKYDTVRDFSADFVQTYEGGVIRKKTTERGSVLVKKPGRMRWTYTAPEQKTFVSDGQKMYSYVPADRQVTVSAVPRADQATTPVLFLVGRGNIVRDFTVQYADVPAAQQGAVALEMVPRQRERDYESLTLVVDHQSLTLLMLVARDSQGGTSTFSFANLKENIGVPDKAFSFAIPRGVDVINQD